MRELFIRIRIILISLIFLFFVTGFLVFPSGIADLANELESQESGIRILLVFLAVLADAALIFIIYQEIRPRAYSGNGLIVRGGAPKTEVSLESVRQNLNYQIGELEDVFAAFSKVQALKGRVEIELQADLRDSVNVKRKSQQINREIVKIVEKQMGLRLARKPALRFDLVREPKPSLPEPISEENSEAKKARFTFKREKKAEPASEEPTAPAEAPPRQDADETIDLRSDEAPEN